MRGTWQGSGTWQTSGPGAGLVLAVAAAVVALAALGWLLARLWWLLAGTAVLAAAGIAGYIALLRWASRHDTRPAMDLPAAARAVPAAAEPQVVPAPQLPAIENHVHYHVHVTSAPEAAGAFTAIPGPSGGRDHRGGTDEPVQEPRPG